ncbi:lantibiotic dehydratase family protein [Flavobacterium reichenbachii]|uniref:Lantibiotic dehydratase N-terminal domain-containing protein n=1 Tax=Flavobacterium reichenbachii TaxID=362418 RepID=A0A085ZPI4_9FLAO|nr:lantibiotic dehydratase family protein [Flavobacterium reichenbachii]KFF06348.1 hypothetical protein IW19_12840 [Flavobacterium reichenbachii]OXB17434.1 hypothetical protein B0A68_03825 [Flavobacterium reichenbachii]
MSKPEIGYSFFSSFVVRTPSYPINFYTKLTEATTIEREVIVEILKDKNICEALYLASPDFYNEVVKWIITDDYNPKKNDKLKLSVLKYLIRMSTRSTPFGLFSACGSGTFGNQTKINIDTERSFYRKTRFDMQFLANLGNEIQANSSIQNELLFYPNTTLYQLGNFYRYIHYTLNLDVRKYSLQGVKRNSYLDLILSKSINGVSKLDLAAILTSKKIDEADAIDFIIELIDHQILVSELETTLTGDDFINRLINLQNLKNHTEESALTKTKKVIGDQLHQTDLSLNLKKLSDKLSKIDNEKGFQHNYYENILQTLKNNKLIVNEKYLFQTDLFLNSNKFQLDEDYKSELLKTIRLLNQISEKPKKTSLENFKRSFSRRYEEQEIPLVKALDFETGIRYGSENEDFDVTPLLDSIGIKSKSNSQNIILDNAEKIIHNKIKNALINNKNSFEITSNDFSDVNFSNENLAVTFSCIFEIVEENEKEWIIIQHIGGSSAANMLGRFCYGSSEISDFANEIIKYESENLDDKLIAEIIHLPEARTGNVLRRPAFRNYEIPYLAQSNLEISKQITIEDIILKIRYGRLILWSKKHNKEIIPRLTNAHNFSHKTLPIYNFLCDMQFENCKSAIGINKKNLEILYDYFPRITSGICIISKATWIFTEKQHSCFFNYLNKEYKIDDINSSYIAFNMLSSAQNISLPQYVSLLDGDNSLLIDLKNITCLQMLFTTIKNRKKFILEEFLFPSKKIITTKNGHFSNQFLVGLKCYKHELKK